MSTSFLVGSRKSYWFLAVPASCVLLAACSAPTAPTGSGGEGQATQSDGTQNQVVLLENQELGFYNPLLGSGRNGESHVYDSLYKIGAGNDPEPVPDLAADAAVPNDDFTQWTVKLKDGISFSDGSSFGPEDVVATYKAILDPGFASSESSSLELLADVKPEGKDSVVFELNEPFTEFDQRLYIAIAPSEAFDFDHPVNAEEMELNSHPIGTGPYVLDSLRADEAVFSVRDDYWGDKPEVQRIVVRLNQDENSRAQQIKTGEGDGTALEARLADAVAKQDGLQAVHYQTLDWRGITLPTDNPVTGDDAIRMALNLGVDREKMIADVYGGHGTPTSTFITEAYGDAYDPDSEFPYDPEQAQQVLDAAGWKMGDDGIRVKDGQRASFEVIYFPNRDAARKDLTLAAASDLKKIGIEIIPVSKESSAVTEEVYRTSAVMLGGGGEPYTVDGQIYHVLHSKYAKPGVGAKWDNASNYVNPKIDKLLDEARVEGDATKRAELYRQLQKEYRQKPGMLVLTYGAHSYVMRDQGYQIDEQIIEPHAHGVNFGPWYSIDSWRK